MQHRQIRRGTMCALALSVLALGGVAFSPGGAMAGDGDYVGPDACVQCHEDVAKAFAGAAHGRATTAGPGEGQGCETCHGPGGQHVESGGEAGTIWTPASLGTERASEMCLGCHGGDAAAFWRGSTHEGFDVSCASCHSVHSSWTNERALVSQRITESCLGCHTQMRKHLYQRSGHPLRDGLMSCVSCHSPHGSPAEASISAVTPNDKCYECHADKRGPFLHEHPPVREECSGCHDPHGSNQTMMLARSAPRLCQSCHLFGHHQTVPGTSGQVWNVNRACLNCHPRIHGSNHPSGALFMR